MGLQARASLKNVEKSNGRGIKHWSEKSRVLREFQSINWGKHACVLEDSILSIYDPHITIQSQSSEASCGNSQNVSKYIWKFKWPRRIKTILKNKAEFLMMPSGKITQKNPERGLHVSGHLWLIQPVVLNSLFLPFLPQVIPRLEENNSGGLQR